MYAYMALLLNLPILFHIQIRLSRLSVPTQISTANTDAVTGPVQRLKWNVSAETATPLAVQRTMNVLVRNAVWLSAREKHAVKAQRLIIFIKKHRNVRYCWCCVFFGDTTVYRGYSIVLHTICR